MATQEMTLQEYIKQLPKSHLARRQHVQQAAEIERMKSLIVIFMSFHRRRPGDDEWMEEFDNEQAEMLAKIADEQAKSEGE